MKLSWARRAPRAVLNLCTRSIVPPCNVEFSGPGAKWLVGEWGSGIAGADLVRTARIRSTDHWI